LEERSIGLAGILIGMLVLAVVAFACITRIGPGYAGVIYNMDGGIQDETLGQGFHMVAPWKHVSEYPISTETVYYTKNSVDGDDKDKKTDKSAKGKLDDHKWVCIPYSDIETDVMLWLTDEQYAEMKYKKGDTLVLEVIFIAQRGTKDGKLRQYYINAILPEE
jgi:hypothetical protein